MSPTTERTTRTDQGMTLGRTSVARLRRSGSRICLALLFVLPFVPCRRAASAVRAEKPLSYDAVAERVRQVIAEKAPDYPKEAADAAVQAMVEPLRAAKAELVQDDAEKYADSMARQMAVFSRDGVLAKPGSALYRFWLADIRFWSQLAAERKRPTPEEEALMAQQRGEIMTLIDQWLSENVPADAAKPLEEYHRIFEGAMNRRYADPLQPGFKRPFTAEEIHRIRDELLAKAVRAAIGRRPRGSRDLTEASVLAFGMKMVSGAAAMQTPQERPPEWQKAARAWSREEDRRREAEQEADHGRFVRLFVKEEREGRDQLLTILAEVRRALGIGHPRAPNPL